MSFLSSKLIQIIKKKNGVELNKEQLQVLERLDQVLTENISKNSFLNFKKDKLSGVYIFGPSGRGKTIIISAVNIYLTSAKSSKIHFSDLIFLLQKLDFSTSKIFQKELIQHKIFFKGQSLICIDELDINNIADIVIFEKFLHQAKKLKIFVILTSNKAPEKIYINNHQKEVIKKLTNFLTDNFTKVELRNNTDYRKIYSEFSSFLFDRETKINNKKMILLRKKIVGNIKSKKKKFSRIGNTFEISNIFNDLLECDFDTICGNNYSFKDYKLLLESINYIFIKDVPKLNKSINDKIKRFIHL